MGLAAKDVVIVSDIGCSGLFDTFFNTHAFHGLHGRALTYATGIKMARPDLKVIVTMGDGGLGIGGAHVLGTCRRNIDLTLLVLNNFNYGMTGGQYSVTTPQTAQVESGFLNRLESPMDICEVAGAAGAGWVERASTYHKDLPAKIEAAIRFEGFSVLDIWGICPGRYTKRNKLTPQAIEEGLQKLPSAAHYKARNARSEYSAAYFKEAAGLSAPSSPLRIEPIHEAPQKGRHEAIILGSAGQRILTAGELFGLAGATAGLYTTQKNDYPITVMRGHSVTEVILDERPVGYTGIETPGIVIALADEGIKKRKAIFGRLGADAVVFKAQGLELPPCKALVVEMDFKAHKIKAQDWSVAALVWVAAHGRAISPEMLDSAIGLRFKGKVLEGVREVITAARQ
jgi:pyruvate/2-oxoacid:ferredoxin oxidoreductase beta subunit/Pyruvate/2-oxoacid:ferredoxin oxidoreductase gamma subunit